MMSVREEGKGRERDKYVNEGTMTKRQEERHRS